MNVTEVENAKQVAVPTNSLKVARDHADRVSENETRKPQLQQIRDEARGALIDRKI
jgi:hypothetical protein